LANFSAALSILKAGSAMEEEEEEEVVDWGEDGRAAW